jgi:hypothetical protein
MESIPFAPEIQNILDLVYFQISKSELRVSLPEVSNAPFYRLIKGISIFWLPSKEQK